MALGFAGLLIIGLVVVGGFALLVPAEAIASATAASPSGRALVERFVGRSRRFRTFGGLIGITAAVLVTTVQADQATQGSVSISLFPALAGAVLGSIVAESFRLRRSDGPRSASLGIRHEVDYHDATADGREWVIGGVAVAVTALAVAEQNWTAVSLFGIVVAVGLIRRWAQHRVVVRGRPALDPDLDAADDIVRRMAVRHGLARPMVTLMALLVALQAATVQGGMEDGPAAQIAGFISLALSITAIVWWWTNRNFGFPATGRARGRSGLIALLAVLGVMIVIVAVRTIG